MGVIEKVHAPVMCQSCGSVIEKRRSDAWADYRRRRYCTKACAGASYRQAASAHVRVETEEQIAAASRRLFWRMQRAYERHAARHGLGHPRCAAAAMGMR